MQNFKILNSKETKEIIKLLEKQFSFENKLDYAFLKNKEDLYLISKGIASIDTKKFRINNLGLYFGEIKNNIIRLSIEASQLIGNESGKNILTLDDEQVLYWIAGDNIQIGTDLKGYVLIKNKQDYLGCGYVKEKTLINYVPKERRLKLREVS